jgi:GxxExxY protein
MGKLIFEEESYAIRGAAMEVLNEMGSGFLEAVFQECLEILFTEKGIPFEAQKDLPIRFRQRVLKKKYVADFVCFGTIIVELKTVKAITEIERAQAINYLKATGFKLALLINFNPNGKLEFERVVL